MRFMSIAGLGLGTGPGSGMEPGLGTEPGQETGMGLGLGSGSEPELVMVNNPLDQINLICDFVFRRNKI